jgi:hypothetical protein
MAGFIALIVERGIRHLRAVKNGPHASEGRRARRPDRVRGMTAAGQLRLFRGKRQRRAGLPGFLTSGNRALAGRGARRKSWLDDSNGDVA